MPSDLIVDAAGVDELVRRAHSAGRIAVDLEFLWERTYSPIACLAQVAVDGEIALVDPIAGAPLGPVADLVADPGIDVVMHAPSADLTLLGLAFGTRPESLFDVQIAAGFVGLGSGQGLGALLERALGVSLDKSERYTDWSRRPLSGEQLSYAADDVRYLVPLYEALRDRLAEQERTDWPAEDFAALVRPELYEPAPDTAWRRVKFARQLDGPALARLVPLAAWRERVAIERDRPRRWILADDALLALARANPTSREALEAVPGLPPAVERRYAGELARLLAELPPDNPPPDTGPDTRMTKEETRLAKQLGRVVDECAEAAGIAASALSPRADLRRLVRGEREVRVLDGWRRALVGERLLECLGETCPPEAAQEPVEKGDSVSSS